MVVARFPIRFCKNKSLSMGYCGIRSTSERYASYWNAFLFIFISLNSIGSPINKLIVAVHILCLVFIFSMNIRRKTGIQLDLNDRIQILYRSL